MAIVGQGITAYPQPDDALNENSKNPVQNKVVAKEVGDLKSAKAPVIIDTTSGAIASFEDGADGMPLKELTVNIEPVQDAGTPSPENPLPISGWTGAIICNSANNMLIDVPLLYKKYIDSSGVEKISTGTFSSSDYISVDASRSLILEYYAQEASSNWISVAIYTASKQFKSRPYFPLSGPDDTPIAGKNISMLSLPSDAAYVRINAEWSILQQIIITQTPDAITFPTEAGTVYGGTLDVKNGILTVSYAFAELTGDDVLDVTPSSAGYQTATFNNGATPNDIVGDLSGVCNMYQFVSKSSSLGIRLMQNTIFVYDSRFTDLATAKAIFYATHLQIVYKLSQQITYMLTPQQITTLLGTNNIWADCGPVSVDYPADTKLYIQKINAPTDDDMTADTQIESGKYFIIGGNLYLSTTTIPAGDTIIPGTNCTKTNLAAALNALNT